MSEWMRQPAVYILANRKKGALYVGVSSNLIFRVAQHKEKISESFTQRYDCYRLVYYELSDTMLVAIAREKQLKGGSRKKKIILIEKFNPEWRDLFEDICI